MEPTGSGYLEFDQVSFSWPNGVKVIDQCSFSIVKPGLWMLVGENGSGKSTLFRLINGVISPTRGKIFCSLKPSMVYQNPDHQLLMPTCKSELMLSVPKTIANNNLLDLIQSALEKVDLGEMLDRPIHTLSGGQKQRLAIASALVSKKNFVLMDEPTSLLDGSSQLKILEIIKDLVSYKSDPFVALWITHRLEELKYADAVAEMKDGFLSGWQKPSDFQYY